MGGKRIEKLRKHPKVRQPSSPERLNEGAADGIHHDPISTQSENNKKRNAPAPVEEIEECTTVNESAGQDTKRKRIRKRKSAPAESSEEAENTSSKESSSGGDRFTNSSTVYIEGLPFDAKESDIASFFAAAGQVKAMRLPRWHDSGRLRGYGHVEFNDPAGAVRALDMDGSYMGKRFIKVDRPMTPRIIQQQQRGAAEDAVRPAGCKTIFVKNLPYDCEEEDVSSAFMFCGKIAKVRLAVWGHTNQLKGFGYVEFKSEESAGIAVKKCMSKEGIAVKGRPVICDFETGQPKGSFKPRTASKSAAATES